MSTRPVFSPTHRGTTKSRGSKHDLDKFYTKRSVAEACLSRIDLARFDRIVEPSAGSGAFSDPLRRLYHDITVALDLAPENPSVQKQDWFTFDTRIAGRTLVVGNPPFGVQCSLAVRFVNHAFENVGADVVAFILPRSFRKASVQRRLFRHAHLVDECVLEPNSFDLEGEDYNLQAVFQVWERRRTERVDPDLPITSRFVTFTKKSDGHDFAIRRVGGKAGHAFVDDARTSEQSNYFVKIRASKLTRAAALRIVNDLALEGAHDGTGPKTVAKRELIAELDPAIVKHLAQQVTSATRTQPVHPAEMRHAV